MADKIELQLVCRLILGKVNQNDSFNQLAWHHSYNLILQLKRNFRLHTKLSKLININASISVSFECACPLRIHDALSFAFFRYSYYVYPVRAFANRACADWGRVSYSLDEVLAIRTSFGGETFRKSLPFSLPC